MATRGQEVELLQDGVRADSPSKGSFALNMLYRRNSWEVRRGFGQVTELDTTMRAAPTNDTSAKWGYIEHLGSYPMTTSFGHRQIISAFKAQVHTGDRLPDSTTPINNSTLSQNTPIYIVDIYDVTTGDRWEEPIFRHTAELGQTETSKFEMPDWRGNYETWWRTDIAVSGVTLVADAPNSFLEDRQQWVVAKANPQQFFFTELDDILYLGNDDTGLLAYIPCVFRGRRRGINNLSRTGRDKQVTTVYDREWSPPYSETSVIINAVASDGPFSDGITYLTKSEFPVPRGGANIGGRLVLFDERNVYFSDVGFPTSIAADNVMLVPSEDSITAVKEHNGNLIIFTLTESWYYQPSNGFVVSAGRLVRMAEGIGCLSDSAVVSAEDALMWMDKGGVYALGAGLIPERISDAIEPFFSDYLSNPVTNYFVENGDIGSAAVTIPEQSPSSFRLIGNAVGAYCRELELVVFALPQVSAALCISKGRWSLWSTETMVNDNAAAGVEVGVTANIESPWAVAFDDGLYIVGSVPPDRDGELLADVDDSSFNTRSRPYYILQYGRGGGVDRSVEAVEDYRLVRGQWRSALEKETVTINPNDSDHYIYAAKPIPIPEGTELGILGGGDISAAADASDGAVWIPILVTPGMQGSLGLYRFSDPQTMTIACSFDGDNWAPITKPSAPSTDVQFFLPPERQPTHPGWVVTTAPNTINIQFDGTAVPNTWTFHPALSLQKHQMNRLIYIPFRPLNNSTTVGPRISFTVAQMTEASAPASQIQMRSFVWDETRMLADRHQDNDVAQAVDWAYKSSPVRAEGGVQVKGRGLFMDALSHGTAVAVQRLVDIWPFGLLNILSAPDSKGWSSQVIDVTTEAGAPYPSSETNIASKNTIRTRYAPTSTGALTGNTFNTAGGPVYGNPNNPAAGNRFELVGDEEISQLAVSDSVRGGSFTYMIWGSIQNKAERLVLESARAVMRVLGGKKRRGR